MFLHLRINICNNVIYAYNSVFNKKALENVCCDIALSGCVHVRFCMKNMQLLKIGKHTSFYSSFYNYKDKIAM